MILTNIETFKKVYMFMANKTLGVNNNKVVLSSFGGKSYSDNPRAISEKLHEMYPKFDIVWLFNNPEEKRKIIPNYIRCVKRGSFRALREQATAKFWIDNFTKPVYVYKNKKQIYIQTWHGDRGFKKILHDSTFVPLNYKLIESTICDLAISGSDYGNEIYKSAFRYDGDILQTGSPRNDILVNNAKSLDNTTKSLLGIKQATRILLYAPTLRRMASSNKSNQHIGVIDLTVALNLMEKKTNELWVCLVRAHSAVSGLVGIPTNEKFIDVSSYEDMSDLLLISDMLITDYSSSAGDFALLDRPIVLFQADREDYLKHDRTFYFDMDKSPYMIVQHKEELVELINEMDWESIPKNCKEILDFYGTTETGEASRKVVEFMLSK